MTAFDRTERYSRIKSRLGPVFEQSPSPHQIFDQMLTDEQALLLRLTNTGKPWALISYTLTTVAGQSEYALTEPVSNYQQSGKVHYVVRATGDANLPYVDVPFDDYSELNYGKMPLIGNAGAGGNVIYEGSVYPVTEKVSVYRKDAQDQTKYLVIQPVPQEVLTYTVYFFPAALDKAHALATQTGAPIELNEYLALKSTAALLPNAMWSDDRSINDDERRNRSAGITSELGNVETPGTWEHIVAQYIQSINAPKTFDMDLWNS